jgi:regulator of protease activity HflC (stomatin/prohibitin superfamily)
LPVAIGLALFAAANGSWFVVDQTELANVRRFGTVLYLDKPLGPGLHFKLPFFDTADKLTVTLQTLHIPPFDVLTVDNQKVTIEENFNYTIAPGAGLPCHV